MNAASGNRGQDNNRSSTPWNDSTVGCSGRCQASMRCKTHLWSHCLVDWSPPDILFRTGFLDDSLVKWRSPCFCARICGQCSCGCDGRSRLEYQSIFIQCCDGWVGNLVAVRKGIGRPREHPRWKHGHSRCGRGRGAPPRFPYALAGAWHGGGSACCSKRLLTTDEPMSKDLLDTSWMEISLVDTAVGNHDAE